MYVVIAKYTNPAGGTVDERYANQTGGEVKALSDKLFSDPTISVSTFQALTATLQKQVDDVIKKNATAVKPAAATHGKV